VNILLTGGCGYVGTPLVEALVTGGHAVTVFDTQWFGSTLSEKQGILKIIKGDIRHIDEFTLSGVDSVIHLANIANDPGVDLNPDLSWEVNVLAGIGLIEAAIKSGARQFIYASSGSVYGVSEETEVTEDVQLVPISTYNKTKMVAERVFLSYADKIAVHCIRPGTVCGWSPRMRLDLTVNILTWHALTKGVVTVFGGQQTRPNIHIDDMIRVYQHFLRNSGLPSGAYNAGFENMTVLDIAEHVTREVGADITVEQSNDPRSYRLNSDKLLASGFKSRYSVLDAVKQLKHRHAKGQLNETDQSYTVGWMKTLGLGTAN